MSIVFVLHTNVHNCAVYYSNHDIMVCNMKALVREKERAIELRKKGYSYNEILKEVNVAKSSLSLWLKDTPLTSQEKLVLRKRKTGAISRGRIKAAASHRRNRLIREHGFLIEAQELFTRYKHTPLFHIGITLYWAEGAKRNNQFLFINSDEEMILVMVEWLERFLGYSRMNMRFRLYIHKPYAHENLEMFWMKYLHVTSEQSVKTIYKPTSLGIKKRPNYKGCLRIEVPKSHDLLCKMKFWQSMQVEYSKKQ